MTFDFRLHVFHTVARRLSFSRAAEALLITQPAVTKHIRALEAHFQTRLFERQGNSIALTQAGQTLLSYTERLHQLYEQMEEAMGENAGVARGTLRIGASTTLAQYILPGILAAFRQQFPEVAVLMTSGNTSQIEEELLHGKYDLGFIEGQNRHRAIKYVFFRNDELVLAGSAAKPMFSKKILSLKAFSQVPLAMREEGSGTLDVIRHAFKKSGIRWTDLHIVARLDSSEAIKNYLLHADCLAFLSRYSIHENAAAFPFKIYSVPGIQIERPLYSIHKQGAPVPLAALFLKYALCYNQGL